MEVLGSTLEMPTVWHSMQEGWHLVAGQYVEAPLSFCLQSFKLTFGVCFPFMAIPTGLWFGLLDLSVLLT